MKRKMFLSFLAALPVIKVFGSIKVPFLSGSCRTQGDQEGPFYKDGAPKKTVIETDGKRLTIQGRIFSAKDCSSPVANAVVDIWHCDKSGNYDNEGYKCRGTVVADSKGNYSFTTIYPPSYGSRPRHIHFKVRAKGCTELTSQIYFKGDPRINSDFARNAESGRVLDLLDKKEFLAARFDIFI
jgi:catechol 1,2-dioxygenase